MSHRIFATGSGIAPAARSWLLDRGCELETGAPADAEGDLVAKLGRFDPDALIVRQGRISPRVLAAAPGLRVICKHGVGTDNIDVAEATRRGIPVFTTPGANTESVAEHALALMLALSRSIPLQDRRIRAGAFEKTDFGGVELAGRTLGLVGLGGTGRRLCELVAPLPMRVVIHRLSEAGPPLPPHASRAGSLEELLAEADVLSLHCALSSRTRGLIDASAFARMKRGAFLVNTARGALIVEDDLVAALRLGRIAGAALDVFEKEPLAPASPLRELDNLVLTPHVAGSSDRSLVRMGLKAAQHALAFLRDEAIDAGSVCNPEVLRR